MLKFDWNVWLLKILQKNWSTSRAPEVLTYFEQSVLSGQHFTISISQISSLTLQKEITIQVLT